MIFFETFDWKASPSEVVEAVVRHSANSAKFFREVDTKSDCVALAYSQFSFTQAMADQAWEERHDDD